MQPNPTLQIPNQLMTKQTKEVPPLPKPQQYVAPVDRSMSNLLASFDLTFTDHRNVYLKSQNSLRCRIKVQRVVFFSEEELMPCQIHVYPLEPQVTVEVPVGENDIVENIGNLSDEKCETLFDDLVSVNEPINKNFERFEKALRNAGIVFTTPGELKTWIYAKGVVELDKLKDLGGITADWKMDQTGQYPGEYLEAYYIEWNELDPSLVTGDFGPISTMVLLKHVECK